MARSMVISLIGRPNVGKSTLFNRLMKKAHKAITFDQAGVTRDRHYGIATFNEGEQDQEMRRFIDVTTGLFARPPGLRNRACDLLGTLQFYVGILLLYAQNCSGAHTGQC